MAVRDNASGNPPKTAFYNDPVIRGYLYQLIVVVLVIGFFTWIVVNTAQNLAAQNKSTGFDFLGRTAGFSISFTLIPFDRTSYYWQAFVVGLLNTLLVAAIGIFFATIIGFAVGIARLSSNWLIARLATLYVEVIRNIPLLLQLFFWYFAVLKAMPAVKDSLALPFGSFLNQRGFFVPRPIWDERIVWMWLALAIIIVFCVVLRKWAQRRLFETGRRFPVLLTAIAGSVIIAVAVFVLSGATVTFDFPELQRFNFRGGQELPPEFVALAFGLSIYTAAFIAETVRGGIKAVSRGQTEAAESLGLREGDRLRLVVLPQAMRVIVPPLTSQYLNLTKNSSLGAAIGYPELVNVFAGTTLNQTGKAIEVIGMTMLVYLTFSLLTSAFMNWYNSRVALVER